jgi:serine/threonine-protein kinase
VARADAAITPATLIPGYRLDRYELLGPLAEGGMASVWIARQRGKHGFEKLVALKTILPQYAADLRFQQMFLDEARIASRIEHFNVARILDLGEEHDVLYLAMEYVDGDALSKLRRSWVKEKSPPPAGVIMRVLADACLGLHDAHELRGDDGKPLDIVHRDVSPHNILVSVKGVAKVIDFGIAKARDRLASETNAGVLKGKIQYMAPEQALGRPVDRRADIWAVGATLYHLLAGKPAYDADNTLGTLHLLTSGRPPDPLPPHVHPAIAAVARKALSMPAEKRYATAVEMRDAMEAAMVDAGIPTTSADVAAYVQRHLAERTAKRRQVIDIALAAAAERERVEELLRPAIERTGSGVTSAPPISTRTLAAAPEALRLGSAPQMPLSSRALAGDASLSGELLPPRSLRGRGRGVVAAVLVAAGLAVAGVVGFAFLRPAAQDVHKPIVLAPPRDVPAASTAAAAAAAAATDSAAIPVFAADSLPKASETPSASAGVAPRPTPVWRPPAQTRPKKKAVDDGF